MAPALGLSATIKAASKAANAIEDVIEEKPLRTGTERVMLPPRTFAKDRPQERLM
jgi:hypothetical protein